MLIHTYVHATLGHQGQVTGQGWEFHPEQNVSPKETWLSYLIS